MSARTTKAVPLEATWITGGQECLLAAAGDKNPDGFRMVLYTGAALHHWYWGRVILDVSGFKPDRQDVAAMRNHWRDETAGWTRRLTAEGTTIAAEGTLLAGDRETEPTAHQVRNRLQQGFPYQTSGRWLPRVIEEVEAEASAAVNGETVQGPVTIFREFSLVEASFCECGLDNMTRAELAASDGPKGQGERTIEVALAAANHDGGDTMTATKDGKGKDVKAGASDGKGAEETKGGAGFSLLARLKDVVGAEKAIALVTARPEATELAAFAEDLCEVIQAQATELTEVRASLGEAQGKAREAAGKVTHLEAQLKAAGKNPVVITATGDGSQPKPKLEDLEGEAKYKAEFQADPELAAEFGSEEAYLSWRRNEDRRAG